MWPARVKSVQGKRLADLGFFAIELPAPVFEAAKAIGAKELMVGVRPEHIVIHLQSRDRAFEAQVVHIEPIGKEFNVYLEANGESLVATVNSVSGLEIGQRVWLAFGQGKVHFFDPSSGEALR